MTEIAALTLAGCRRTDLPMILRRIEAAIAGRHGLSMIGLGDGEGAILGHENPAMAAMLSRCVQIWPGPQSLSGDEMAVLRAGLDEAIAGADIIGLPRPRQLALPDRGMAYQAAIARVEARSAARRALLSDACLHVYLQYSGAIGWILAGLDRVTVIGCRDVAPLLTAAFGIGEVRSWLVRGEAAFPGPITQPHWPDGFDQMLRRLEQVEAGDVVLVGAGVFGKIYCDRIRRRGGIALDLGSVLDGWAGVESRGNLTTRAINGFPHLLPVPTGDADMMARLRAALRQTPNISDGTF